MRFLASNITVRDELQILLNSSACMLRHLERKRTLALGFTKTICFFGARRPNRAPGCVPTGDPAGVVDADASALVRHGPG